MTRSSFSQPLAAFMAGLLAISPALHAAPVGTAFTYQGRLVVAGTPASGSYDFQFQLFDTLTLGNPVGSVVGLAAIPVTSGSFTVTLDFGAGAFNGLQRWLEVRVQPNGGSGYTTLAPRQELTATPNALYAITATTINGLACMDGEIPKWSSGAWTCATDAAGTGTVTSVGSGAGLTGGPITTSGALAVDLGGSGAATTVSRTDHDHLAQTWVGTGIGLTVNTSGIIGLAGRATAATGDPVGVRGQSDSTSGAGVYGIATGITGFGYGVQGIANSSDSRGVYGSNNATSGVAYGVYGLTASTGGIGVSGSTTQTAGSSTGVLGSTASTAGRGVNGLANATNGVTFGVRGQANSTTGRGVYGFASATTGTNYGIYGQTNSTDGYAGYFSGRVAVDGPFQLPTGAALGSVLTSDLAGNASWLPPATTGTVTSLGTGSGLTGGPITSSGTISLNFASSGSATTVSRGDHDHFGQTWSSSGAQGLKVESSNAAANVIWGNSAATSGGSAGVYGSTESSSGYGVYGDGRAASGPSHGVYGRTLSTAGLGVFGLAQASTGLNYGVFGRTNSSLGSGVYGYASATGGVPGDSHPDGLRGEAVSHHGHGVHGVATGSSGTGVHAEGVLAGLEATGVSPSGYGVFSTASATSGFNIGVFGQSLSSAGTGVRGQSSATIGVNYGVYGRTNSSLGSGVYGYASATGGVPGDFHPDGLRGEAVSHHGHGVHGVATGSSGTGVQAEGVLAGLEATGVSPSGYGVFSTASATSGSNIGVFGQSLSSVGTGVRGQAPNVGVYGWSYGTTGTSAGVYGIITSSLASGSAGVWGLQGPSANAWAGWFSGRVNVTGFLSKSGGGFKIDHPLDPESRYLNHSFVESPDMKNFYDGVVTTDTNGLATIELPAWFEALNRDFRYQLTVLDEENQSAFVQAKVIRKLANKRFTIRTSMPEAEVSWQVTGIRKDAWAVANPMPVEENKSAQEQGTYLAPEAFGQPSEKGHDFQRRRALNADTERDKEPPVPRSRNPGSN